MSLRERAFPVAELVTDQLETSSLDHRTYLVIRLRNALEVMLVHDPNADKASAAMDVAVGTHSDKDDMPGMAHAVEHLLFMGTEKYPAENEYGQYLAAHSGVSNAYTSGTSTNFYFEVSAKPSNDEEQTAEKPSPLRGALDRFAQFFVKPLFLASTLDRELRAIDSEYKKNLQSDDWRLKQLERYMSNPEHPYGRFEIGNLETLKIQPEARGINVRDKFIEFYEENYSANLMKLCVLGREPLDVLESWVCEYFSGIKNKNLLQNRWPDQIPLPKEFLGVQCFAKPVMDFREVSITFPFLDEDELFEAQPSRYLDHLIGHEGPGSIMAYIKGQGWANSLLAGACAVCPGSPGLFRVTIRLTEEGLKNYTEVVKVVFQYIALLREAGPQQWIFNELKYMTDMDFKFKENTSPFTSQTSAIMQRPLPRKWLLSGTQRLRKFDARLIKEALGYLRPDNFRLTIVSKEIPRWEGKEKWYGTEYTLQPIPPPSMAEIQKAATSAAGDRIPELHLPHKNQFIPTTELQVEKKEVKEPAAAPRIIRNDGFVRAWYKKDDTFWVPKANLRVSCKSPIIFTSARNYVMAMICTDLVRDALEEYSYDASLAGYYDKLVVLLEKVLITMRNLEIRDDRFATIKERLTREELAAELPTIMAEALCMVELYRSLIFPPGSNYVWKKTLKDKANVNHCINYWLYLGKKGDGNVRAKLRTEEQLGYVVFFGVKDSETTCGFNFLIQSEKTAPYLETRIELFLETLFKTIQDMSETDFENNKCSSIVKRLEKPKDLKEETARHWRQIHSGYYDFGAAKRDVADIESLTKVDMIEFFSQSVHPASPRRAKLVIHFTA
ncbi:Metalloenzyme, LuxS/M16 peptidase-like protein [Immersiella caudata]|uniref:Metalloenzyme, LuxS/M16 peptidase-like protein n=1 Tax=Immersiella caudata TaxID=314043 RepID=A0AA39X4J4_9PEZI|nr:Metalloenzyme, LuxS/M16 peptidase-like protein [Immersiella caudata]